jgi:Cytochrome c554 and c-prime
MKTKVFKLLLFAVKIAALFALFVGEFTVLPFLVLNMMHNPIWAISVLVEGFLFTAINIYIFIFIYRYLNYKAIVDFLERDRQSLSAPQSGISLYGEMVLRTQITMRIFGLSMMLLSLSGFGLYLLYPNLEGYFYLLKGHIALGTLMFFVYSFFLYFATKRISGKRWLAWLFALYPVFVINDVRTPLPLLLVFLYNIAVIAPFLILLLVRSVRPELRKDAVVWSIVFFAMVSTIQTGMFAILDPTNLRFAFVQRIYHGYFATMLLFMLPLALLYAKRKKVDGRELSYKTIAVAAVLLGLLSLPTTLIIKLFQSEVRESVYRVQTYDSPLYNTIHNTEPRTMDTDLLLGSLECLSCHPVAYNQWVYSTHAYSSRNIAFQTVVKSLIDKYGTEFARDCATCHEPALAFSDEVELLTDPDYIMNRSEGVSCRSCHFMSHAEEKNGVYKITIPRSEPPFTDLDVRADFMVSAVLEHRADYTKDITMSGEHCYPCHSLRSKREAHTYVPLDNVSSYLHSSYATQKNIKCHDCHMPRIVEDKFHYSWKDHRLFGSHTYLDTTALGLDNITEKGVRRFARDNLDFLFNRLPIMEIFPAAMDETFKSYQFRDYIHEVKKVFVVDDVARGGEGFTASLQEYFIISQGGKPYLDLTIELFNNKLGHDFPSSLFANIVRCWTEIEITDARGKLIHRTEYNENDLSNQLGRIEITDDGQHILPHESLDYTRIVNMRFITPDTGYDDHYQVLLPPDIVWPLKVEYKLQFQRYNNRQVAWMSKGRYAEFAPLTLARLTTELERRNTLR